MMSLKKIAPWIQSNAHSLTQIRKYPAAAGGAEYSKNALTDVLIAAL
ncbi:hypothetical protein ymoll0001_9100 [Yersinia mollaretii ATCC 43969]|uniref:Uncharacterized protein n=1 Tax=Yersinia mollaretii (strain ATCC 43969 / DSM 18520 / CIP 103324 / CNY 7263 / WAIP 204) TaxID=349967 RepID=A0ABM9YAF5_YERMW|nr:hypothetical protein ymoll0001_9100 [Yersinia mollaretii ATCC 43969]